MPKEFNIHDMNNYKRTAIKKHEVHVCIPHIGTRVKNEFEGVEYITTKSFRIVTSGVLGEFSVISMDMLLSNYETQLGADINRIFLTTRLVYEEDTSITMPWIKCVVKEGKEGLWACNVPNDIQFRYITKVGVPILVNDPKTKHAKGDFIVCGSNSFGKPDLRYSWVVNGELFPTEYNMRTFQTLELQHLLNLVTPKPSVNFSDVNQSEKVNNIKYNSRDKNSGKESYKKGLPNRVNDILSLYLHGKEKIYSDGIGEQIFDLILSFIQLTDYFKDTNFEITIVDAKYDYTQNSEPQFTLRFSVTKKVDKKKAYGCIVMHNNTIKLKYNNYGVENNTYKFEDNYSTLKEFKKAPLIKMFKRVYNA